MGFLYFYLSMGHFEITVVTNSSDLRNYHINYCMTTKHISCDLTREITSQYIVRWKDMLITKHIVSMKLVGLTPVLRPLFPYEFEIPAGPSMYPGSGGNSRTGSPPVVQFVGFLGRIRFTPQDEKVLPMDIQLFRKIKLRLNHYYTEHSSHTSMCINDASLLLAYQSINWWQNSVHIFVNFIEIEWWQSFHYIYQLHCIWQSLVCEVITYSLCNTWFV